MFCPHCNSLAVFSLRGAGVRVICSGELKLGRQEGVGFMPGMGFLLSLGKST